MKAQISKHYGVYLVFIIGGLFGFFVSSLLAQDLFSEKERGILLNTQFTSPYLECPGIANSDPNLVKAKKEIEKYISEVKKSDSSLRVSVYLRDLNNGPWIGVNEQENFAPASLIKVPLMIYYFNIAQQDPAVLEREFVYDPSKMISIDNLSDFVGGEYHLVPGESYTTAELIERMIIHSDNHSADLLYLAIDNDVFNQMFFELQLVIEMQDGEPVLNAKNYSSLFRVLYNADFLSRAMSEQALELLSRASYQQGLARYIPESIPVSAKYGVHNYGNPDGTAYQVHDCGIIYQPEKPYLACIMTRSEDSSFFRQAEIIAQLSKIIFEIKTQ